MTLLKPRIIKQGRLKYTLFYQNLDPGSFIKRLYYSQRLKYPNRLLFAP